ncbi:MAG: RES family NAD+ phosphorylase [Coriobacteriia bacterium]|nr:RES family NAD+ phosphorylase [Coriobacteriia bacterium]
MHSARFEPTEFNPTDPDSLEAGGGGRFDSPGGEPPYLYAARSSETAIAEALLRDLPFDARGARELPAAAIAARSLSRLEVTGDLSLVALHGAGLAKVGQDTWLVHSDAGEYLQTREWGRAILSWNSQAHGLEWRPRHDDDGLSMCLYQDRAAGRLKTISTLPLWEGEGLALARAALLSFGVASSVGRCDI